MESSTSMNQLSVTSLTSSPTRISTLDSTAKAPSMLSEISSSPPDVSPTSPSVAPFVNPHLSFYLSMI